MFKTKINSKAVKDPDIVEAFNNICGNGFNQEIVEPKYDSMVSAMKSFIGVLKTMVGLDSPLSMLFRSQQQTGFEQIDKYVVEAENYLSMCMIMPLPERVINGEYLAKLNNDREAMEEYLRNSHNKYETEILIKTYRQMKESVYFQNMILTAKNLKDLLMTEKERRHTKSHDLEELSIKFIANCEGDDLRPFEFSSLDFKQMYYTENLFTPDIENFVLKCLQIIYNKCNAIVEIHLSPDVDTSELSESIIKIIKKLKNRIPRCEKAFNKITNAVNMLRDNLGEYYKDYVTSQNPSIIIESFIVDVAKSETEDREVAMQFAQIIKYFKSQTQNRPLDARTQKIMNVLSKKNDKLLRESSNNPSPNPSKSSTRQQSPANETQDEKTERELSFLPDHLKNNASKRKK